MGVIPGPEKPAKLVSFLKPIYEEVKTLGERGLVVKKSGQVVYSGKVFLMGNTGDIPGIADLMKHDGHLCQHGCRICDCLGEREGHAMCFPNVGNLRTKHDLVHGRSVCLFACCIFFFLTCTN